MNLLVDDSYQLGKFRDNEDSLRRLKQQASIVLDFEFKYLQEAGLKPDMRVLDLGCGPGIIASEIALRSRPRKLLAADCNETSLSETRHQLARVGAARAEVKKLNVYDDQLATQGPFDFVYSRLVFQHLSNPMRAMSNVHASLADQGRLCVCDIDDHWLTVVPEPKEFNSFIQRAGVAQSTRGGDRYVGSKLSHYMKKAGFTEVRSSILLVSTDMIGVEAFWDLVFGYKLDVIPNSERKAAIQELIPIKNALHSKHGWAGVAVFFVSGQR